MATAADSRTHAGSFCLLFIYIGQEVAFDASSMNFSSTNIDIISFEQCKTIRKLCHIYTYYLVADLQFALYSFIILSAVIQH